ncbi:antifreeze protein [Agrocybe pediades]|nr:antifreeze protein [Agrocybe pediades]
MLCILSTVALCILHASGVLALGPAPVNLGTAGAFVIIAQAGVSTVPSSAITGDVGVSAIAATGLTGFSLVLDPSGTFSTSSQVSGRLFAADYTPPTPARLTQAVSDMQAAYTDAMGRPLPLFTELAGGVIGGQVFVPGLYKWSSTVSAATSFTFAGSATDTWIFQIAGTYDLATGVNVRLVGGALPKNIVWAVAGAVTLHAGSNHKGVILGKTGITVQTAGVVKGRLFAQTAVALQSAKISA